MAFTYTQVTAITNDLIKNKMTDGVFTSNQFLKRLREKQELEDGGNKILCPIMTKDDTGTTGAFYSPRDNLSLAEYDGISASEHDWKYLYESVVIYKADIAKNSGKYGVLKLIDSKVRQAERAFGQRLVKGVLSDGTNSTGALDADQYVGLQSIIAASGTYGGIAPADLATWVSTVDDNSGTGRALTQAILDGAYDNASEPGQGEPSLGLCKKEVFTKVRGLLTTYQRTTREDTLDGLGHKGQMLVYNGTDVMVENQMWSTSGGDGVFIWIDEDYAKLHVHKDHNMRRQSIQDLETADALLERIFLYSAYVASERKFHSKINDINT